jgi:hypothetical protein
LYWELLLFGDVLALEFEVEVHDDDFCCLETLGFRPIHGDDTRDFLTCFGTTKIGFDLVDATICTQVNDFQ